MADLDSPQIVIRRGRQALPGGLLLVIASVWIGIPFRGFVVGVPQVVPGLGALTAGGALLIGVALALIALGWLVRREVVAIEGDLVTMTDRRLVGSRVWREPLTRYRGVRRRRESHPHRYGRRHWHAIELWHPKAARTVELERTRDPRLADEHAEAWARRLRLPLCRELAEAPAGSDLELRDQVAAEATTRPPLPAAQSAPL